MLWLSESASRTLQEYGLKFSCKMVGFSGKQVVAGMMFVVNVAS